MSDFGAKVQTNSSGEKTVTGASTPKGQSGSGVTSYREDANLLKIDMENAIGNDMSKLPGSIESNNINWFGGSYSGADIKVVAHMYEPLKNEEEVARIEHDLHVAEKIRDGCAALLEGGITTLAQKFDAADSYQTRKAMFLFVAGISNQTDSVDAEAASFLTSHIYAGTNWSSYLGLAKVTRKTEQIKNGQKGLADSLSNKLEDLKKILNKGQNTVVLATLQTLSVQSHREKGAVRALGHARAKGYTRGPRTIAGSMIFTVFNEHALAQLTRSLGKSNTYKEMDSAMSTLLPDQLPPIDLTIAFANEYGSLSEMRLFGVEFFNDAQTYSIEDLLTEGVMNFVARDADPMTSHGNIKLHRSQAGMDHEFMSKDLSGSQLLFDDEGNYYKEYLARLGLRNRFMSR